MLKLINATKIYKSKGGDVRAVDDVTLTFEDKGLIFLTGKSGSGKTTLLNIIGGLDNLDNGSIKINGKEFSDFKEVDYDSYRNTYVGFVFQEFNLIPEFTVKKNIAIANELQGKPLDEERINALMAEMEIENLGNRKISQISGGQKQRVAIVRALIKNPYIILADEPTGALDSVIGEQIMEILKRLSKEKLVVVVSHDRELAERYADRIIKIKDGKVESDVTVFDDELLDNIFETENELTVRGSTKLTNSESASVIQAIEQGKNIKVVHKLNVRKKKPTHITEEDSIEKEPINLIKSKMKLNSCAKIGASSLFLKPIRLCITVLLSVITFAIFGVFDTLASYNRNLTIQKMIEDTSYQAMTVNAQYTNKRGGVTSYVKWSQEGIDALNTQTGADFRGVYHFDTYWETDDSNIQKATIDSHTISMKNSAPENRDALGAAYYGVNVISGMVEFKEEEITNKVTLQEGEVSLPLSNANTDLVDKKYSPLAIIDKDGYNLKLIVGKYPGKVENEDTSHQIAISRYTADMLIHYGIFNEENYRITKYEDILGTKIEIDNDGIDFTIVGIIECGDISSEFDALKTVYGGEAEKTLKNNFEEALFSSMNTYIFAGENQINYIRKKNNAQTSYNTNGYIFKADFPQENDKKVIDTQTCKNRFFCSENFSPYNVLFFNPTRNPEREEDGKIELADNEVLVNAEFLHKLFYYEKINLTEGRQQVWEAINDIARSETNYDNKEQRFELRKTQMRTLLELIGSDHLFTQDMVMHKILSADNTNSNENETKIEDISFKVVGVYYSVENGFAVESLNSIVCTKNALKKLDVYAEQGYFARAVAPFATLKNSASTITDYLTTNKSLGFEWYRNSILQTLVYYEEEIDKIASLFLYASMALCVFSVAMLFNFISTSIAGKRKTIGVLRALGSNGGDVMKIFLTESIILALINFVLAIGFAYAGCLLVNLYITNIMQIKATFLIYGFRQILIIFGGCILTGLIGAIIPVLRFLKEKPVDLIVRAL